MASQPGLASSVTSKRSRFQPASAEVISPAMPGWPCQSSSARSMPGAAGWLTHGMLTGTPRTPATAHSTWGLSAGGAECTCRTPRTVTLASLRADEVRLPQRPRLRRRPAQMPGSRDMLPLALLFGLCLTTGPRRYPLAACRIAPVPFPRRSSPCVAWHLPRVASSWCSGLVDASAGTTDATTASGRLSERDIAALLFVADMYAVQLDQLAAVLRVTQARARAVAQGWRRAGYTESARIGPGPPWFWLTRSGLSACGLPYRATSPALSRLAHLRAVTAVRLAIEAAPAYAAAEAFWRGERRLRAKAGGRVGLREHIPDAEVHWPDGAPVGFAGECWAIEAELTPKTVARTAAIMHEILARTGDYGCPAGQAQVLGAAPRHARVVYLCSAAARPTVAR